MVVVPLLLVSMIFLAIISIGFARNGITKIASDFLGYKINEIVQKARNEHENLQDSEFRDDPVFQSEIKNGIRLYAQSITNQGALKNQGVEAFVAIDKDGVVQMSTDPFLKVGQEIDFFDRFTTSQSDWISFKVNDLDKVGFYSYFEEWEWYFLLSVYSNMFYRDANRIFMNSVIILSISILIMIILLFFFINYLLNPLQEIVNTMDDIIKMNDLSNRVPVRYNDEIGELAFTFNNMLEELEGAYTQIKEYAYQAVLSQKKEERIKVMFQKYVPQDVVDEIVHNPDKALIGKKANVTILFSDIRSFTTISESMPPDELVKSLNSYFTSMVNIIYNRKGVIDKYIGDAIMAIFGAPKEYGDDVQQAVLSGLEMIEALDDFNRDQKKKGYNGFNIGVGINYGPCTVGNIGTTQKMDYTVIGDAVNLASRLEGLTKEYEVPVIISERTRKAVEGYFYFRLLGRVRVQGKLKPVSIYEPSRKLTSRQKNGWKIYDSGMNFFLDQAWDKSEENFIKAMEYLGNDPLCRHYLEKIAEFREIPPEDNWDGTVTMTHK
jgi:adenylate cyclase